MNQTPKTQNQPLEFEQSLAELEQVVRQMEAGDLPLDEALALFERGIGLARLCRQRLDGAERRIDILLKGPGAEPVPMPFETTVEESGSESDTQ
ncbi:MAG TPA: exodeoxyribonuclease VII small subunit [Acidobacteriota bacterium]|nr:exodeoxyribonuclease VII small subunit [Acidobacteriota bacterium]HNG93870.1 exodeoxyribonuclease VII small subunit [Acidobacteriota bacterium]